MNSLNKSIEIISGSEEELKIEDEVLEEDLGIEDKLLEEDVGPLTPSESTSANDMMDVIDIDANSEVLCLGNIASKLLDNSPIFDLNKNNTRRKRIINNNFKRKSKHTKFEVIGKGVVSKCKVNGCYKPMGIDPVIFLDRIISNSSDNEENSLIGYSSKSENEISDENIYLNSSDNEENDCDLKALYNSSFAYGVTPNDWCLSRHQEPNDSDIYLEEINLNKNPSADIVQISSDEEGADKSDNSTQLLQKITCTNKLMPIQVNLHKISISSFQEIVKLCIISSNGIILSRPNSVDCILLNKWILGFSIHQANNFFILAVLLNPYFSTTPLSCFLNFDLLALQQAMNLTRGLEILLYSSDSFYLIYDSIISYGYSCSINTFHEDTEDMQPNSRRIVSFKRIYRRMRSSSNFSFYRHITWPFIKITKYIPTKKHEVYEEQDFDLIHGTTGVSGCQIYGNAMDAVYQQNLFNQQIEEPISGTGFNGNIVKLFTYPPPPATHGINVSNEDLFCLNDGEYLNDVIIDFYIKYLSNEIISKSDQDRTHFFSSFFYSHLMSVKRDELNKLTYKEERHTKVKRWTRNVDIFTKDFIVIPINESYHWFLAIICFPNSQLLTRCKPKSHNEPISSIKTPVNQDDIIDQEFINNNGIYLSSTNNTDPLVNAIIQNQEVTNLDEVKFITIKPLNDDIYNEEVNKKINEDGVINDKIINDFLVNSQNCIDPLDILHVSSEISHNNILDDNSKDLTYQHVDFNVLKNMHFSNKQIQDDHKILQIANNESIDLNISMEKDPSQINLSSYDRNMPIELQSAINNDFSKHLTNSINSNLKAQSDAVLNDQVITSKDLNSSVQDFNILEDINSTSKNNFNDNQTEFNQHCNFKISHLISNDGNIISQQDNSNILDQINDKVESIKDIASKENLFSTNLDNSDFPSENKDKVSNIDDSMKVLDGLEVECDEITSHRNSSINADVMNDNLLQNNSDSTQIEFERICLKKKLQIENANFTNCEELDSKFIPESGINQNMEDSESSNSSNEFKKEMQCLKDDYDENLTAPINPCILIFDSLKGESRYDIAQTLREYLQLEWNLRKESIDGPRIFDKNTMKGSMVNCPQQPNSYDCGLYVLQYVESFFKDPVEDFLLPLNLYNWFSDQEAMSKRLKLAHLILSLTKQLQPDLQYDAKYDGCLNIAPLIINSDEDSKYDYSSSDEESVSSSNSATSSQSTSSEKFTNMQSPNEEVKSKKNLNFYSRNNNSDAKKNSLQSDEPSQRSENSTSLINGDSNFSNTENMDFLEITKYNKNPSNLNDSLFLSNSENSLNNSSYDCTKSMDLSLNTIDSTKIENDINNFNDLDKISHKSCYINDYLSLNKESVDIVITKNNEPDSNFSNSKTSISNLHNFSQLIDSVNLTVVNSFKNDKCFNEYR